MLNASYKFTSSQMSICNGGFINAQIFHLQFSTFVSTRTWLCEYNYSFEELIAQHQLYHKVYHKKVYFIISKVN